MLKTFPPKGEGLYPIVWKSKDDLQKQAVRQYEAIGTGDTELYLFAGMLAAVVISIRVFLFRGAGKAN